MNVSDLLSAEELRDIIAVLSLICVELCLIAGWCMFDILWRVFLCRFLK